MNQPIVSLFEWNPSKPVVPGRLGRKLPIRRKVNNFGDLLGPLVVRRLLEREGISEYRARSSRRLITVGSVMHFAQDGDVVWGTGVNGKISRDRHRFSALDVRAVRGPLTADFLRDMGINAPRIFGDPALLLPGLDSRLRRWSADPTFELTIVPNFNDWAKYPRTAEVLNPRLHPDVCLERIARSRLVISSSLHGVIVAESLGIPAILIKSTHEPVFKYEDYFRGTDRPLPRISESLDEAVHRGETIPPLSWDGAELLDAFPRDLWERDAEQRQMAP